MNSENAMMIKKNSALIQVHAKTLSAIQRKIINSLIYTMQNTGLQSSYDITISALKKFCNISMIGNNELKDSFRGLADIKLEFNYLNKDKNEVWEYMSLLSRVKIVPNEGTIVFELPEFLRDKLINPRLYAPIDIILIAGFKSSYSIVLYELMRDYLTAPSVPTLTIDDLKNLFGIKSNEYKCFNDFKKRVIDVAAKEVNEKTDICCHYDLIKEIGIRNKYSHIRFFVSKKTNKLTYENNEDIKQDCLDLSMDLFESVAESDNKIAGQISDDILSAIPETKRTQAILNLVDEHISKGKDKKYVISNIKYSLKANNFPAYLKQALEKDYAGHDREIEKLKKIKVEKIATVSQMKKHERDKQHDLIETVNTLPEKERDKLRKKAVKSIEAAGPANEFTLSETMIALKMSELYERGQAH